MMKLSKGLAFCLPLLFFGKAALLFPEELWHKEALPPPLILKDAGPGHAHTEGDQIDIELDSYFRKTKEFQKSLKGLERLLVKSGKKEKLSLFNKESSRADLRIRFHKVKKGESVWSIAKKYKLGPSQVLEHNFKIRRRVLYIGERLAIPLPQNKTKRARKAQEIIIHRVKKGETLYSIAKKYRLPLKKLKEMNKKKKHTALKIGERLKILKGAPSLPQGYRLQKRFQWPLQGKITSGFGFRSSPFSRRRKSFHKGIDIAAKMGSPIKAIEAGVVMRSRAIAGYGNCIFLLHPQNYISVYAHNSRNFVRRGQLIPKGKVIASVGQSGSATGPHLHFEVRKLRRPINPIKAMKLTRLVKDS